MITLREIDEKIMDIVNSIIPGNNISQKLIQPIFNYIRDHKYIRYTLYLIAIIVIVYLIIKSIKLIINKSLEIMDKIVLYTAGVSYYIVYYSFAVIVFTYVILEFSTGFTRNIMYNENYAKNSIVYQSYDKIEYDIVLEKKYDKPVYILRHYVMDLDPTKNKAEDIKISFFKKIEIGRLLRERDMKYPELKYHSYYDKP